MTTSLLAEPAAPTRPASPAPPAAARPRWERPALAALLLATAAGYLWNLNADGYGNSFYAAAVEAATKSWKAFFFGSLDSSNFITVDKPPASLWLMDLSARIFGFSTWSLLVPEVLLGVGAVWLLYAAVRRWFGPGAGLVAGAVLALTPVAALMFRFDNPDALLSFLLVAAAYTLTRAVHRPSLRWVLATGGLLGLAFLAKMLQAFLVVPAFALVYLVAAPVGWRRRVGHLLAAGGALVVAGGWWVAVVALLPAGSRPYVDGSPDNSILNLIFVYNGFSRLSGSGQTAGFSGTPGVLRLFNDLLGGQISWLLPAALVALAAGLWGRRHAPRTDRARAALLLWGGWLLVTGAVLSFGRGVIHTYYTVALAPAVAALVAIGVSLAWARRDQLTARAVTAATVAVTGGWAWLVLDRTPTWLPWLRVVVAVAVVLAAGAVVAAPRLGRTAARAAVVLVGVATLAGPVAYTAETISTAHNGAIPSAGPATAAAVAGPGGGAPPGGVAGRRPTRAGFPGGASGTRPPGAGFGATGQRPNGAGLPGGTRAPGGGAGRSRTGAPRGGGGAQAVSKALVGLLESDSGHYRWVAATFGSQTAASIELATGGRAVMAIGGFDGQGGNLTLAQFQAYVGAGDIHWFVAGGGTGGPGRGANSDQAITAWVAAHYKAVTVGGQTVYDLAAPK